MNYILEVMACMFIVAGELTIALAIGALLNKYIYKFTKINIYGKISKLLEGN